MIKSYLVPLSLGVFSTRSAQFGQSLILALADTFRNLRNVPEELVLGPPLGERTLTFFNIEIIKQVQKRLREQYLLIDLKGFIAYVKKKSVKICSYLRSALKRH